MTNETVGFDPPRNPFLKALDMTATVGLWLLLGLGGALGLSELLHALFGGI